MPSKKTALAIPAKFKRRKEHPAVKNHTVRIMLGRVNKSGVSLKAYSRLLHGFIRAAEVDGYISIVRMSKCRKYQEFYAVK